ncbi:TetR/AcrR family transcriptional regulator C-terminal domain-containing protein [Rhodococcus qingshengii]|uniref:TetR/AcrR family transcriptional regulator C-terminal domain-containing protein n=1 Tax=Rhodococcus qingshengii TaxID=334542 RepID=UPI001FD0AA41|nr:TetR/AcrR family transcriptional regulator C-terminal domain-containing protein [Rhodococcus qingshengii]
MSEGGNRRVGRPSTKVLSRQVITDAAFGLIEKSGYASFTVAALSRALGVAPSALYNHVRSKREVLLWLQEDLMTKVDVSGFGEGRWTDALRRWAVSYREVFASHAPLVPVIAVMPVAGAPRTLAVYESVAAGLTEAGWPVTDVVPVIVAVESFIFGSALDATAPTDIFDTADLGDVSPVFTAAVAAVTDPGGSYSSRAGFEAGLDAMIAGFESRLNERPAGSDTAGA